MIKPTKIKLELMSDEIEAIKDELESVPHTMFKFMNYQRTIKKLKEALEDDQFPKQKKK